MYKTMYLTAAMFDTQHRAGHRAQYHPSIVPNNIENINITHKNSTKTTNKIL